MSGKAQDTGFRHPEAVAFLESLTDGQAAKQPPLTLEQDGVVTRYWREGGRVRCREFETDGGSGVRSFGMEALHAAVEAEFGRSLPLLEAELGVGGVPDLDAIETAIRERALGLGAKLYADLLEARDAALPSPSCPRRCGRRMERHSRAGKTFRTRLGPVQVERTYFRCRDCGVGFRQLDRTLGLEGKTVTPGAESLYADAASSDSYEESGRKLKNLAGVEVPASTLQRHVVRIGEEMQAFEREDAEAEAPASKRVLLGIDGTGVPMAAREVEGVAGKQADGTAKTSEAKAVICFTADGRDPKTGEPRKDRNSGAVSVRIDSAQAVNGVSRTSDFAARLEQFGYRNALFKAEELVVLSDGAPWIRTVCEETLAGPEMTFILDLFHALEYAAAAVRDVTPDEGERAACMDWIREQLNAGQVAQVIAVLEPHRRRSEARSGLHPLLRSQRRPNAVRPLSDARTAGRIRRRGKRLQEDRRQPIQKGGMPLVESRRQCPARHKMLPRKHALARLPRVESLSRRSRVTKENGMHPDSELKLHIFPDSNSVEPSRMARSFSAWTITKLLAQKFEAYEWAAEAKFLSESLASARLIQRIRGRFGGRCPNRNIYRSGLLRFPATCVSVDDTRLKATQAARCCAASFPRCLK